MHTDSIVESEKSAKSSNERISIRATAEDVAVLTELAGVYELSQSECIRMALKIAKVFDERKFVMVDEQGRQALLRTHVDQSSSSAKSTIQVRRDPDSANLLEKLQAGLQFGTKVTDIVRNSLYFFLQVTESFQQGLSAYEIVGRDGLRLEPLDVLDKIGMESGRVARPSVGPFWAFRPTPPQHFSAAGRRNVPFASSFRQ